ncbi:hypothetical protein Q7P37_000387 [Cladosporium fusiforme]
MILRANRLHAACMIPNRTYLWHAVLMGRFSKIWSRHKSSTRHSTDSLPSRPSSTLGTLPPETNTRLSHIAQSPQLLSKDSTLPLPATESKKSTGGTPNTALAKAIATQVANLSGKEKTAFLEAVSTEQSLLQKIKSYDQDHAETSQLRKAASKLEVAFETLKKFCNIVSVATSGNPEASIAIGAARVVFDIALGFLAFFSKLTDMISRLSDFVEPLLVYSTIPEHHTSLQNAVIAVYGDILRFCQKSHAVFVDERGNRRRMPTFRVMWRTQWLPFEAEFGVIESDMQHHLRALQHSAAALTAVTALDIQSTQQIQMKEDLLNWLSDFPYEERHEKRFARIHPGTADWLLDTDEFLDWFRSTNSEVLWCHGGPGMGKSFLAANVLEYITSKRALDLDVGVAFVYYDHQLATQQGLEHVIRALLKQLCRSLKMLPDHLVLAKQKSLPVGSTEDFIAVAETLGEVFIVVDALDECTSKNRPDMLAFLREITKRVPLAKIYVTSRPEIDIARDMEISGTPTLSIDVSSVAPDIEKYVSDEVQDLRRGRHGVQLCVLSDDLADDIVRTLTAKAHGMFLWVRLQLENLCRVSESRRDDIVRVALSSLPEGLDDTYLRIAQQIEAKPEYLRSLAVRALQCVFYAQRPLNVEELLFALAVLEEGQNAKDLTLDDIDVVSGACANLIVLELAASGLCFVRPAHYSIQQFFTTHELASAPTIGARLLDESSVNAHLALLCMSHLRQPIMSSGEFELPDPAPVYLIQDPFLQYAAQFFDKHIVESNAHVCESQILDFLDQDAKLHRSLLSTRAMTAKAWTTAYIDSHHHSERDVVEGSPLSLDWLEFRDAAAESGWSAPVTVAATLLYQLPNIRERYRDGEGHALHYACRRLDHSDVMELLDRGSDLNARDGLGCTALAIALRTNHQDNIHALIERGADVNASDDTGTSVLQVAVQVGWRFIVQQLLEKGADVNTQGGPWGNALYAAANKSSSHGASSAEITEMLLEHGADVNARGGHCGTALACAIAADKLDTVEMLLSNGASVHVEDAERLPTASKCEEEMHAAPPIPISPLYLACLRGITPMVELLLGHGADVNREEGEYGNAMFATLEMADSPNIVALLIQGGFRVDIDTLTTAASRGRKKSLIKILSEYDEGPGFSDIDIGVALVAAWRSDYWPVTVDEKNHKEVIKILKTRIGLDVDMSSESDGEAEEADVETQSFYDTESFYDTDSYHETQSDCEETQNRDWDIEEDGLESKENRQGQQVIGDHDVGRRA